MSPVTAERSGGVLVLTLNQPDRRNVLDLPMAEALADALTDVGDARAIALLAAGDHFCVGGDVRAMHAADEPAQVVGELARTFHRAVRAMRAVPPVVVGLRGWAAGAGMSTVLAADLVVAGESSTLQPAYPGIGVTPDGGMSWTLPRLVGERRAKSILLRNTALSAADAHALGLIDEIVPDDRVDGAALELARTLAAGPAAALAGAKRLAQDGAGRPLADHLDAEADSIAACAAGPEGREGIAAFVERRRPDYTG